MTADDDREQARRLAMVLRTILAACIGTLIGGGVSMYFALARPESRAFAAVFGADLPLLGAILSAGAYLLARRLRRGCWL